MWWGEDEPNAPNQIFTPTRVGAGEFYDQPKLACTVYQYSTWPGGQSPSRAGHRVVNNEGWWVEWVEWVMGMEWDGLRSQ